ncbi:MAG: helicase-related protein [Thermoproteota archaeon]
MLVDLKSSVQGLVTNLLEELKYHPMIAPYLNVSRENPPKIFLHQCELSVKLSLRKPLRVFIADEIGLGKTFSAISLAKVLETYDRIKRVLIIVPRVLVVQWKNELTRAGIPYSKIHQLERWTISWLKEQGFPDGYYLASMDLLKREKYIDEVSKVSWDLVIVDEAHKFGEKTERYESIGKNLVEKYPGKNVIFLSATPHRGDSIDYLSRLELLDPFLVRGKELDNRQFYELTHGAIVFRRTKEDVNNIYECRKVFPDAKFYACLVKTRSEEEKFVADLVQFLRTKLVYFAYELSFMDPRVVPLLTVLIFKRASSSPYSAYTTLQRMLAKRAIADERRIKELVESVDSFFSTGYDDFEYDEEEPEKVFEEFIDTVSPVLSEEDKNEISKLRNMAQSIMKEGDSKLNALCALLEEIMAEKETKVVIFTEYKDTLNYVIENLIQKRHPEWRNNILRLSSEEAADVNRFQEIKERFEKDSSARILFATDVVAEGVNLQVANILINYEIPWSLVKLEQRIGRVWRLGQKKLVKVYTLFMNNVADKAALEAMYRKLGNLKVARLKPRPFTGEEIFLYSEEGDVKDMMKVPAYAVTVEEKGKKKFKKITEAEAILTYIKENSAGLEKLIESIIKTKAEIEKEMYSKGILYMPKTRDEVENALACLGFKNTKELMLSLVDMLKSVSEFYGLNVEEEGNIVKVSRGSEMATTIENVNDIYGFLHVNTSPVSPYIVAYGEREGDLAIYKAIVKGGSKNETLYSEPVGIFMEDSQVLRGSELIETVSRALSNCIGVLGEEKAIELPLTCQADILSCLKQNIISLQSPLKNYMMRLESMGWRDSEIEWLNPSNIKVELSKPLGYIRFVKHPTPETLNISQKIKDEVEDKAVQIVLEKESEEGRIAVLVPESEHYDIKSVNIVSGEVRKIEVKGHAGSEVYGELTDPEMKLAEKERDNFWLYIVYDVLKENPKILRFRNPVETMNWKVFERVERRYIFWPKELPQTNHTV